MKLSVTATQIGLSCRQMITAKERLRELKPSALIHGGCVGGDNDLDKMAADLGIDRFVFPSTVANKRVPDDVFQARTGSRVTIMAPKPPLERNADIVRSGDHLVACPRTALMVMRSGTWMTVRLARRVLGSEHVEVIAP